MSDETTTTDTSKVSSMEDLLNSTTGTSSTDTAVDTTGTTATTYDPVLDDPIIGQQYLAKFQPLKNYESTYEERTSSVVSGVHFNTKRQEQKYLDDGYEEITVEVQEALVNGKVRKTDTKELVDKPPVILSLDDKKSNLLAKIDSYTATQITDGFTFDVTENDDTTKAKFDSSKEDQLTFATMYSASLSSDFATNPTYQGHIPMRGRAVASDGTVADTKSVYYLDAKSMQRFMDALALHIGYSKQVGWTLQNQVKEATDATYDEVEKAVLAVIEPSTTTSSTSTSSTTSTN